MARFAFPGRATQLQPFNATNEAQEWVRAHEELSRLAKSRAQLEWEEGRGLLAALRAGVHGYLGFASFAQYVEALFGYKPRSVEEKLRVAEALESLPLLSEDLRVGGLTWSAVRELTRVATQETERAWREVARGKTVRQIEDWVSGRKPGDTPDSPADPALRRHVLAFEVRAETLATFREALVKLRRDAGGPLDEEAALLLMARQVLGGPSDPGRASYQIAVTLCEQCGRGFQQGRGELFEVDPEVVRMATCDAQYIGRVDSGEAHACRCDHAPHIADAHVGDSSQARGVDEGDNAHEGSEQLQPATAFASARAVGNERLARTADAVGNEPQCAHVGEERSKGKPPVAGRRARATQDIPPATRRRVVRRDRGRCVVPGCIHATFLDIHHVELRSEGGSHDPATLVTLCAAHHRAIHRGALILEGSVAEGLVFRHADGSSYRAAVSPRSAAAQTQAFAALRRLGFREGDVRRALDRLRSEVGLEPEDARQVLRAALQLLTPSLAMSPNAS